MSVRSPNLTAEPEACPAVERGTGVTTFVLIHGAGDVGWAWHRVEAELRARGRDTVAPGEAPADYWAHTRYGAERGLPGS